MLQLNIHALYILCGSARSDTVNSCMVEWCTQNVRRDGSSSTWPQPCNDQIALQVHHFDGYSKRAIEGYCSHSFKVTRNKRAEHNGVQNRSVTITVIFPAFIGSVIIIFFLSPSPLPTSSDTWHEKSNTIFDLRNLCGSSKHNKTQKGKLGTFLKLNSQ